MKRKITAIAIAVMTLILLVPTIALAASPPSNCLKIDNGGIGREIGYSHASDDLRIVNVFDDGTGKTITAIWFHYNSSNYGKVTRANVVFYALNSFGVPTGDPVYSQPVTISSLVSSDWNRIALTTPYEATSSFAAGVQWVTNDRSFPMTVDTVSTNADKAFYYSSYTLNQWTDQTRLDGGIISAPNLIRAEYKPTATLSLSATPVNTVEVGSEITLSASIDTAATGTLTFKENTNVIAVLDIATDGTEHTYTPSIGTHDYTVEYSGDTTYAATTAALNGYAVTKKAQTNVPDITVQSVTKNSITVSAISGVEYNLGGQSWQDSHVFSGLTPNTTFTIYARYAESLFTFAGEATTLQVTTLAEEEASPSPPPSPSESPTASTPVSNSNVPPTGDTANILPYILGIAAVLVAAGVALILYRKKKKQ